jgi:hypothetical protein
MGILRAQQYESIASNLNAFASPEQQASAQGNHSSSHFMPPRTRSISGASGSVAVGGEAGEDAAVNILNVFVGEFVTVGQEAKLDDEQLAEMFYRFAQEKKEALKARNIRRLTFSVAQKRQPPSYFTYRARDDYKEDKIYRHLEPALAFQLEIYRLRSFYLELIPTSNLKMHLYLGKAKVNRTRVLIFIQITTLLQLQNCTK